MEKIININIINTKVKLSVQDKDFYSYLKSVLEDYLSPADKDVDIVSRFEWHEEFIRKYPLRLKKKPGYENIGPNIALSRKGDHLEFLKKIHGRRFKGSFDLIGRKVQQNLFCHKKMLKDLVWRLKQRPRHLDYFEIAYFLFYYPLFWFLENFRDIYPMHASCIDTPKGGIIIAGLPGSGKSVTSLALWSKHSDNRLLSDNIILYDRETVYSCPEPIRLHDEGKRLLGDDGLERIDMVDKKPSKGFYKIRKNRAGTSRPVLFLLVRLSEKYALDEIDAGSAVTMAFNQNLQGAEILNYFEYASLASFLYIHKNLFRERLWSLDCLFKGMKSFLLSIPRNRKLDTIVDNILDLL